MGIGSLSPRKINKEICIEKKNTGSFGILEFTLKYLPNGLFIIIPGGFSGRKKGQTHTHTHVHFRRQNPNQTIRKRNL